MTPVFGHGHLRLYLLSLLAEEPRHGYELIQELGRSFGGTYVPSAGTIYPRLAKLEEDGLVTKVADGRKTVYAITDAGRAELAARETELDGIESEVTDSVRRLADEVRSSVTNAMKTLRADLASAARTVRQEARDAGRSAGADANSRAAGEHSSRPTEEGTPDAPSGTPSGTPSGATAGATAGAASGTGSGTGSVRVENRVQLERAEMILADFRQEIRSELRSQVVSHELSAATVLLLEDSLDEVRLAVLSSLRSSEA